MGYFERRFGIPLSAFAGYQLVEDRKAYRLISDSPHLVLLASFKVQNVGMLLLRKIRHHLKPTTAALQRFGHHATQHRVELTGARLTALLQHGELSLQLDCRPGYVVLVSGQHILGCGLYTPGRLRSQLPRRMVAPQHEGREW